MSKINLACFPYAGGSTMFYSNWKKLLPPDVELHLYELAGRGLRTSENGYDSMEELAKDLLYRMKQDHFFEQPYFLFGHSLGALIVLKLCYMINFRKINSPKHVFFSGEGVPTLTRKRKKLHILSDNEFLIELEKLGGITDDFIKSEELQEFYMPILRNDLKIAETAVFQNLPILNLDFSILIGKKDNWTEEQVLRWKELTTANCTHYYFEGGHFYINDCKNEIIKIIASCIK